MLPQPDPSASTAGTTAEKGKPSLVRCRCWRCPSAPEPDSTRRPISSATPLPRSSTGTVVEGGLSRRLPPPLLLLSSSSVLVLMPSTDESERPSKLDS